MNEELTLEQKEMWLSDYLDREIKITDLHSEEQYVLSVDKTATDKDTILENLMKDFINDNIWEGSKYEWIYALPTTVKGKIGERLFLEYFKNKGEDVRKDSSTVEWDILLNNKKIEIKLSMLNKTGLFKFLQIRPNDGYGYLSFVTIQPHSCDIFVIPKDKVEGLKPQHSGERGSKETMYLGISPEEMFSKYKEYLI